VSQQHRPPEGSQRYAVFYQSGQGERTFGKAFDMLPDAQVHAETMKKWGLRDIEIEAQAFANGEWSRIAGTGSSIGCGDCLWWHRNPTNPAAIDQKMGECRARPPNVSALAMGTPAGQIAMQLITAYPQRKPNDAICGLFEPQPAEASPAAGAQSSTTV
jgi:hypothetical protein